MKEIELKIKKLRAELAESRWKEEMQKKEIDELWQAKTEFQERVDSLENTIAELVAAKSTLEEDLEEERQNNSDVVLPLENLTVREIKLFYSHGNYYQNKVRKLKEIIFKVFTDNSKDFLPTACENIGKAVKTILQMHSLTLIAKNDDNSALFFYSTDYILFTIRNVYIILTI